MSKETYDCILAESKPVLDQVFNDRLSSFQKVVRENISVELDKESGMVTISMPNPRLNLISNGA